VTGVLTVFCKFVTPFLLTLAMIVNRVGHGAPRWLLAIAVGWLVFWRWWRPLKRVEVDGDQLRISNYFESTRIPLTDIVDVAESHLVPTTLYLRQRCRFGPTVTFLQPLKPRATSSYTRPRR